MIDVMFIQVDNCTQEKGNDQEENLFVLVIVFMYVCMYVCVGICYCFGYKCLV